MACGKQKGENRENPKSGPGVYGKSRKTGTEGGEKSTRAFRKEEYVNTYSKKWGSAWSRERLPEKKQWPGKGRLSGIRM